MQTLDEQIYANALALIPQLGPVRLNLLFKHFKSWKKIWEASSSNYAALGFNTKLLEQIMSAKSGINPQERFSELAKQNIEIVLNEDSNYPQILREISAAPPILYLRGNRKLLNTTCVGIVGTRKITPYGRLACTEIVSGLVNSGLTIVSGLAFGVDAQALETATAISGRAIAVLASPLDDASIGPKSNFQLSRKIIEHGLLLSEYPLGYNIQKQNFPIRNRIISGLSVGTLVVEADIDSGSLITANFALEQNREVFAIPGSIFSEVSRGTNNLIKKGAKLVNSYTDILEELNLDSSPEVEIEIDNSVSDLEQQIIETLTRDPMHIDDLTRTIKMPAASVSSTLILLEMKGRVRNVGGAKFAKIR